ncbi:MAG: hypothetical protein RSB68_02060 [Raoultibacter sp.]
MFKPKAERQIAQAADKIVSQKEGLDALSWNRVMEIAHILQGGCNQEISVDLGSELSGIAHSNISLSYKLGIEGSVHTGQNMPSGIEMLEGTTPNAGTQAVEGVQAPAAAASLAAAPAAAVAAVPAAPEAAPSAADVPEKQADTHNLIFGDYVFPVPNVPAADPLPEAATPAVSEVEAAEKVATAVVSEGEAAAKAAEEARRAASAEKDREFARYFALPMDDPQEKPAKEVVAIPVASVNSAATTNPFPKIVASAPAPAASAPVQQTAPAPPVPAPVPAPVQPAPDPAPAAAPEEPAQPAGFARFRNVYSSRDDRLCMFEDAEGHLIAVDASKLA